MAPIGGAGRPDLQVVDGLARLALEVARQGGEMRLLEVQAYLAALLDLCGLAQLIESVAGT